MTSTEAIQAFEALEAKDPEAVLKVTLAGRIRSMRPMGKVVFTHIEDGDGRVQLFLRANEVGEDTLDLFKT